MDPVLALILGCLLTFMVAGAGVVLWQVSKRLKRVQERLEAMQVLSLLPDRVQALSRVVEDLDPGLIREEFERIETLQAARDLGTAGVAVSVSIPFSPEIIIGVGNAITEKAEAIAKEHGVSRVDSVMAGGDAADVILNCAKDRNADLIVMGTRGLSDLKGLFVGSVSHKVSHLADCSCIMVR